MNVHRTVTLASLVEKETAIDGERPMVASVFENRLQKNMPLMTDPAVIYGLQLQNQWRGTLYESDLKRDTAYNTYVHPGLRRDRWPIRERRRCGRPWRRRRRIISTSWRRETIPRENRYSQPPSRSTIATLRVIGRP